MIEHHMLAHKLHAGTLGHRAKVRVREHEDFDDLVLLGECDRARRKPGFRVCSVEQALAYIAGLNPD